MSVSFKFYPGKYWIGSLSHVINRELYEFLSTVPDGIVKNYHTDLISPIIKYYFDIKEIRSSFIAVSDENQFFYANYTKNFIGIIPDVLTVHGDEIPIEEVEFRKKQEHGIVFTIDQCKNTGCGLYEFNEPFIYTFFNDTMVISTSEKNIIFIIQNYA
jgi:hypothetical protein